jgi:CheY-like chemotaxis protein
MSHQCHDVPRIFMAEDNPGDVMLMRAAFDDVDLAVDLEVIGDGETAIRRLLDPAHEQPDLIILNFNLPKRFGYEVLEAIRTDARLQAIPVVIVTTSSAERDALLCARADAYFVKGGDWEDVLAVVRQISEFLRASPSKRLVTRQKWADQQLWRHAGGDGDPGSERMRQSQRYGGSRTDARTSDKRRRED